MGNTTSESLRINSSTGAGVSPDTGTNFWTMTNAGVRTMPLQPAFFAYLTSNTGNTTGDTTVVSLNTGTPYTEVIDQGSNLATTGIFTAPVTGFYKFSANLQFTGTFTLITQFTVRITTTARTIEHDNTFSAGTWGNLTNMEVTGMVPMTAGDTAFVKYSALGAASKVAGLLGGDPNSYFCGTLIC